MTTCVTLKKKFVWEDSELSFKYSIELSTDKKN